MRFDDAAVKSAAMDGRAIRGFVDHDAQRAQARGHGRDAVGFLDPQLGRATHHGGPFGAGGGHEQCRELVDHVRHVFHRHLDAA